MGEREIVRLLEENIRIRDELTVRQMQDDADALKAAERNDGFLDLLSTPL